MTDPSTPLTDDELLLALDGEAAPELLARIEADEDARARLAQFRADAQQIAALPAPLSGAEAEPLIAAALAALETEGPSPAGEAGGQVQDFVPRPSRPTRGAGTWLVAAVVLVCLGLGLTLVYRGTRPGSEDTAAHTADAAASAGDGTALEREPADAGDSAEVEDEGSAQSEAPASESEVPETTGAPGSAGETSPMESPGASSDQAVALGSFSTEDEYRRHVVATDTFAPGAEVSTLDPPSAEELERCTVMALNNPGFGITGGPVAWGWAEVAGEQVVVYEFAAADDDGTTQALITSFELQNCDPRLAIQR